MYQGFVRLLDDDEATDWIIRHTATMSQEARRFVMSWGRSARRMGVKDFPEIHAEFSADWDYQKEIENRGIHWLNGDLQDVRAGTNDHPREHVLVSWVPMPIPATMDKTASEQQQVLDVFKAWAELPDFCPASSADPYRVSLGSAYYVAMLARLHFQVTGRDPFNGKEVRTDTLVWPRRESEGRLGFVLGADKHVQALYGDFHAHCHPWLGAVPVGVLRATR